MLRVTVTCLLCLAKPLNSLHVKKSRTDQTNENENRVRKHEFILFDGNELTQKIVRYLKEIT